MRVGVGEAVAVVASCLGWGWGRLGDAVARVRKGRVVASFILGGVQIGKFRLRRVWVMAGEVAAWFMCAVLREFVEIGGSWR